MTAVKATQAHVSETIAEVQWEMTGDDTAAQLETRKRARLCGPDAISFLSFVMRSDGFASSTQRVRAATVLLDAGGFLASEAKATGLFSPDETDGAGARNGR
jgi:hypothetical protein